jgi:molybdopterin-guanine dinucleotide biosynthesis protein A
MDRSAVILTGGSSTRFGQDKAVFELKGKPLLKIVTDTASTVANEIIVVTNTQERADTYAEFLEPDVKFAIDFEQEKGPLIGALTGFEKAQGTYSLLLPSNTPLVSVEVLDLLFELSPGKTAVIPRWPNQQIEPLHAVYHTKTALKAGRMAIEDGFLNVQAMIDNMGGLRYISTLAIQTLDPELKTFFNVNTPIDLKMAETLTKPRPTKKKKR